MPTAPTLDDLRRLQRDEGQLIRGFELDLRQALIAETDPGSVTKTWKGKLDQFLKRCEDLRKAPTTPKAAADLIASIQDDAKKRFDDLADRAKRAHDRRPEVNDKLVRSYDEAMSGALAKAPGQAVQAGHDQIHRAIRQLVESALPQNLVKADQSSSFTQAKNQMSDALSRWVEDQDVVEDAFFVAQSALLDTAQFIQRQLFIQGQIKDLKKWTEGQKTLDAPTNKQVDAQAGQLGKAYVQSDRQGEQAIRRAATIKPELRLDPHFVLDPTKRFLADVNLRAGITIDSSSIKIQLNGNVTITEPLDGNRKLSANEDLQVQKGPLSLTEKLAYDPTRGTNLSVGAGYTRGAFTGGVQYDTNFQGNNAVKATITFRF